MTLGGNEPFPPGSKFIEKHKGPFEATVVSSVPLAKELKATAGKNRPPIYQVDHSNTEDCITVPFSDIHHPNDPISLNSPTLAATETII